MHSFGPARGLRPRFFLKNPRAFLKNPRSILGRCNLRILLVLGFDKRLSYNRMNLAIPYEYISVRTKFSTRTGTVRTKFSMHVRSQVSTHSSTKFKFESPNCPPVPKSSFTSKNFIDSRYSRSPYYSPYGGVFVYVLVGAIAKFRLNLAV